MRFPSAPCSVIRRRMFLSPLAHLRPACLASACAIATACSGAPHESTGQTLAALGGPGPVVGLAQKCLDDQGANTASGTPIQLWDCNGTDAQEWTYSGGQLIGIAGKCLDVQGDNQAPGTVVQLWDCNGTAAQQWSIQDGSIVSSGGFCLDVTGDDSSSGTRIDIWGCNGQPNQRWTITGDTPTADAGTAPPTGPIVGLAQKCLDDQGANTASGTPIQMWDCNGTDAQEWTYSGGQLIGIAGKCLDVQGDDQAAGTVVQLWDCNGTAAQQWSIQNGAIVSSGGLCLDVTGDDSTSGTRIDIWGCNGQPNQQWIITGGDGSKADAGGAPPVVQPPPPGSAGGGVTSVTTSCSGALSTVGTECTFHVSFDGPVVVGGSWHPRLNLATSPVPGIAYYCGGSGTPTLDFCYTLWGGQAEATVSTSASAINLNGATIQSTSGVDATLDGANSVGVPGLSFSPGNAYCVSSSGGDDGSSGICGAASFATLTQCQAAMQASSVKTCFLQGGTYAGLSTCNFNTNTGVPVTAYVCRTGSDDGEVWAAFPGETPVLDGQATAWNNGVFVPFESNGTKGNTIQGLTMQHFAGGGPYEYQPVNLTIEDNIIQDMYNNGGTNGEVVDQGPGGCTYILNWWTNVRVSHNLCQNLAGYGISTNSGQQGTNGYSMTFTYDNNIVTNVCTDASDCGGIYGGWYPDANTVSLGTGLDHITNNIVNGVGGPNTQGVGIYLDDYASGETVTGNIVTGMYTFGMLLHNGSNNILSNNIWDVTAVSPNANENDTVFYMPTSNACAQIGQCGVATNNTISGNIVYNGYSGGPPAFMGLYYGTSLLTPPTLGTNWFYTTAGSFQNAPFCWAGTTFGGGGSGVCDSSGVLLGSQPFVGPTALTAAGYQLQAGPPALAAGFPQMAQTQGPR